MSHIISERQIEIIEASGKILMEKGILGLTTKNIAKEMNFSESALYRHFKDKEAIIILLISYLSENISLRFDNILKSKLNPEEKLIEFFKSQFSFFNSNPHFIVIILSEGLINNSDEIKTKIFKLIQSNSNNLNVIIEEGQKTKIFNQDIDAKDLVHFIMGSFRLQMLKWKFTDFSYDIEKQGMKTMLNLLTLIKK